MEDTDETALLQAINQLSPLVIVDESCHARSTLSKEILQNAEKEQNTFENAMTAGEDFAFKDIHTKVQENMSSYA